MAERKSGKTLTPQPAGQTRLPRITGMPAHIEWNAGPHETESNILPLGKTETE